MKETYTRDEVMRIVGVLGKIEVANPEVVPGDHELFISIGYEFRQTENSFGGYTRWLFTGINCEDYLTKLRKKKC